MGGMAKIYTRTGDTGKTRLVGGTQVFKTDARLDAYGTVDELNSMLGLCQASLTEKRPAAEPQYHNPLEDLGRALLNIQNMLFFIGSRLASENEETLALLPTLPKDAIDELETQIDTWTQLLPPLKEFILPGGQRLAAEFHLARCICRRAERATAHLSLGASEAEMNYQTELSYLNRLSDYLFTAARFANFCFGQPDRTWKKS